MSFDTMFPIQWNTSADQALLGNLGTTAVEALSPGNDDEVGNDTTTIQAHLFQYANDDTAVAGYYADMIGDGVIFHVHYTAKNKNLCLVKLGNEMISNLDIKPEEIRKSTYKSLHDFCKKQDASFPFSIDELTERCNKIVSDSKFLRDNYRQAKGPVYATNINNLRALLEDPNDPECIDLVVQINAYITKMEIEARAVMSGLAEEASNPWRNIWAARNKSFSLKKLKALYEQLKDMDYAVKTFRNADFKSGKAIVDHVNKYFVARNDDEKFLIYYPFINLSKEQTAKMINLLIVMDPSFSSWLSLDAYISSRASINSAITNGDILLNLFSFCSEADRLSIMEDMEKADTLYDLFSLSYYDCYTKLSLLLGNTWLKSKEKQKPEMINTAIENGNHIFFNTNLFGSHNHEDFDDKARKITFRVSASSVLSLFDKDNLIRTAIEEGTDTNEKTFFDYKGFKPLDPVVITSVVDVSYAGQDLKKGEPHLMPACMAYLMFREETKEVATTLANIAFQVALCFIGVEEVIAAIKAGSVAAGLLGTMDIAIGVGGVIINTVPEIGRNHPDFVKYYNYFTYVWTVCRILGSLGSVLKEKKESLPSESVENFSRGENIDWMGKPAAFGNYGGRILKAGQIRKLKGILSQHDVELIIQGNKKGTYKLFKPADGFEKPQDLFYYMFKKGKVGGFHAETKQFFLTEKCTEIVAFHEMEHFNHYKRIGAEAYAELDVLAKETEVWEKTLAAKHRWSEKEFQEAFNYYNSIRKDFDLKPIILKKL